jgi:hypothetical protein
MYSFWTQTHRQAEEPQTYVRVADECHAVNNPQYTCKVGDGDFLEEELHMLCSHSLSCSYLSADQETLAFYTVIEILMMCGY